MKRRNKADTFLYCFWIVIGVLCLLTACGVEYTAPVTIERSEIKIAASEHETEVAASTVQERTEAAQTDHLQEYEEYIGTVKTTEGETNDGEAVREHEGESDGRDIHEGTEREDTAGDACELSDSGRDISDSGAVQADADAQAAGEGQPTEDGGYLSEHNGAEQADTGADLDNGEYANGNEETEPPASSDVTEEAYLAAEATTVQDEYLTYVGDWTITFYCDCAECVGQYAGMNMTASGREPIPWYTVATGSSYPFGTELYIEGFGYFEVMDRGVSDGWADIYVSDHSEIPSYGMTTAAVYIVG